LEKTLNRVGSRSHQNGHESKTSPCEENSWVVRTFQKFGQQVRIKNPAGETTKKPPKAQKNALLGGDAAEKKGGGGNGARGPQQSRASC